MKFLDLFESSLVGCVKPLRRRTASNFFTVVTHHRRRFLTGEFARRCLREAIDTVREERPFEMPATILLPEHLHAIWKLPRGDADYSTRWQRIKEKLTIEPLPGWPAAAPKHR